MIPTLGWRNLGSTTMIFSVVLLTGCSQRISSVNETLKEAFWGIDDVELSAKQIADIPFASAYVRLNDGPKVFMVLAYAEKNPATGQTQLKWVSQDQAMIVTERGRIVKTLNLFQGNLVRRTGSTPAWRHNIPWSARYDWSHNHQYGYLGNINLVYLGKQTVTTPLWSDELNHWQENVSFPQLKTTINNQYWVNKNEAVLKSVQYLGPDMARLEMDILKPYVEAK